MLQDCALVDYRGSCHCRTSRNERLVARASGCGCPLLPKDASPCSRGILSAGCDSATVIIACAAVGDRRIDAESTAGIVLR